MRGDILVTQTFQIEMFMKWYCSNARYVDLARISVKSNRLDCVFQIFSHYVGTSILILCNNML